MAKKKQPSGGKKKAGCSPLIWLVAGGMFILYSIGRANPSSRITATPTERPTETVRRPTSTFSSVRIQTPSVVPTIDLAKESEQLAKIITGIDGVDEVEVILGAVVYIEAEISQGAGSEDTADAIWNIIANTPHKIEDMAVILNDGTLPVEYVWRNDEWHVTELEQIATAKVPTADSAIRAIDLTVYTSGSARLRSCANTTCSVIATLGAGEEINAIASENGEVVNTGNAIWYKIDYNGREAFVYSGVVSNQRPSAAPVTTGGGNVTSPSTAIVPASPAPVVLKSPFGCNGIDDLNCADFYGIGQNANAHLAVCGDEDNLDGEGDGRACER